MVVCDGIIEYIRKVDRKINYKVLAWVRWLYECNVLKYSRK